MTDQSVKSVSNSYILGGCRPAPFYVSERATLWFALDALKGQL